METKHMGELITLDNNSPEIQHLCKKDKRLAKVISMIGPITYKTYDDPYEFLIHEIIEQMLSIKVGKVIFSRLVDLCNGKITPSNINKLTDAEIKSIGISQAKVSYIRSITVAVKNKELNFNLIDNMNDAEAIKYLTSFRGIGKWTANMFLIFVLNRKDILPTNDVAFLQSYEWLYKTKDRSEIAIYKKCKKWKPYASIASRYP